MTRRTFPCGEADYLTDHGVPLKTAALYARCYGPAAITRLWARGITPDTANTQPIDTALLFSPKDTTLARPTQQTCRGASQGPTSHTQP